MLPLKAGKNKHMKEVTIRVAVEEDLPIIHDLVRELAIYEKGESEFIATLEEYRHDFAAGIFQCLVSEVQEQIVGMALYYMTYSTWKGKMLYLEDFVILKSHRRQGIGQLLFDGTFMCKGLLADY